VDIVAGLFGVIKKEKYHIVDFIIIIIIIITISIIHFFIILSFNLTNA